MIGAAMSAARARRRLCRAAADADIHKKVANAGQHVMGERPAWRAPESACPMSMRRRPQGVEFGRLCSERASTLASSGSAMSNSTPETRCAIEAMAPIGKRICHRLRNFNGVLDGYA